MSLGLARPNGCNIAIAIQGIVADLLCFLFTPLYLILYVYFPLDTVL